MSIFEFSSSTKYLTERLSAGTGGRRGLKSRFAEALKCDGSHVTRLLDGSAQLSLEQGMRANAFFGHTEEEGEYLLALIGHARAGTGELKRYYEKRLRLLKDQHLTLSRRVGEVERLPEITQATYYSLWLYAAVDIATSVPALQTEAALCEYFQLPLSTLGPVLAFLRDCGLVENRGGKWVNTGRPIYLSSDSPHVRKHHLNWRLRAMQAIEQSPSSRNLHYSSVVSLSEKDFERLKEHLIQAVGRAREIVKASKDETIAVYNIDCFLLK